MAVPCFSNRQCKTRKKARICDIGNWDPPAIGSASDTWPASLSAARLEDRHHRDRSPAVGVHLGAGIQHGLDILPTCTLDREGRPGRCADGQCLVCSDCGVADRSDQPAPGVSGLFLGTNRSRIGRAKKNRANCVASGQQSRASRVEAGRCKPRLVSARHGAQSPGRSHEFSSSCVPPSISFPVDRAP